MKQFLAGILAAAFLLGAAGCTTPGGTPGSAASESSSMPESAPAADSTAVETRERITDYDTLFMLWHDYLYFGYLDIQRAFETPAALERIDGITRFAYRALLEYGDRTQIRDFPLTAAERAAVEEAMGASFDAEDGTPVFAVSSAALARVAETWFDIAIDDPTAYFSAIKGSYYTGPYYLPTTDEVLFLTDSLDEMRYGNSYSEYPGKAWFGMAIQEAYRYGDGHIEVSLTMEDTWAEGKIGRIFTYTLLPRESGDGYRIHRCTIEYADLERYQFSGSYAFFDEAAAALPALSPYEYTLCAEGPDSFYLLAQKNTGVHEEARTVTIVGIDKETLERTALLEYTAAAAPQGARGSAVSVYGTKTGLRLCDAENVIDLDWALKETHRQPLPEAIRAAIAAENGYYFSGYAALSDFSRWFFSDRDGLWQLDPDGSKTLLAASTLGTGKLMEGAVITPQLQRPVGNDSALFYFTYGYEWITGETALDIASGVATPLAPPTAGSYIGSYALDEVTGRGTVLLEVDKNSDYRPVYYDFAAKTYTPLTAPRDSFGEALLNGDVVAIIGGGKVDTFTAELYDLKTDTNRPADYSIYCPYGNYGDSYLGVLADGRVLFCCEESPVETHFVLLG